MSVEIGQYLKGRYRIQSILGEGGMGTVFLAQDVLLDRPRAIKELYPDPLADEAKLHAARLQFQQEAQALSELRHRNLPHVSDYFSIDENDYLVMDYIAGESLADILARKKRPTERLVYSWLKQILDALDYCHRSHVLHRDIKPANIILTPEGRVILVDFSLVKMFDPHNPRTATLVRGLGTPEYTPLEQYDASMGHTDARSDIYGLGATIYHLLTGHPPQPVSQRILNPDTQPPIQQVNPKISPWMVQFVRRSMAIRPENRFQNVDEMRQEIDTRLFKLKEQSRVTASVRRAPETTKPQTVRRQYRHGSREQTKAKDKRYLDVDAPDLMPVIRPAIVPLTVTLTLAVIVTIIFVTGSPVVSAVVGVPLVLGALIYNKLSSRRRQDPPKF
jgi:serine/threonine-protein kinase